MTETHFFVPGTPQPKGSTRAFIKNGRAIVTSSNSNMKDWQNRIAQTASGIVAGMTNDAVEVEVHFRLARPKSLPKRVYYHTRRPDLDKLVRTVLDALTGIAYSDDSQVVRIVAKKRYAESGEQTGVLVFVRQG